jgi:hypothetical protein
MKDLRERALPIGEKNGDRLATEGRKKEIGKHMQMSRRKIRSSKILDDGRENKKAGGLELKSVWDS